MQDDAGHWVEIAQQAADMDRRIDAYEIRADTQEDRRIVRRNGVVRTSGFKTMAGLGVRAFAEGGTGYAFTNEVTRAAVEDVVERAAALAAAHGRSTSARFAPELETARRAQYAPEIHGDPLHAGESSIHDLLQRAEHAALEVAPEAKVQVAFGFKAGHSILVDSAGSFVDLGALHSTLIAQTVLRQGGKLGDGNTWIGGERGVGDYEDEGGPEALGRQAGEQAVEGLTARALPAGRYRALTDGHLTGLMAHESFGHLTEYDLVASGWSVLEGRLGQRLANEQVTIRDSPVVEGAKRGVAVPYDQEGTPGRTVTLLENGRLNEWLHARDSAHAAEVAPTGNGRALNISYPPIVRMRNTYVEPGDLTFEEAVELVGDGVYLVGGRGGSPRADGSFMFTSQRGYLIEGGRLAAPVNMASIYGNVLDFLQRVEGLTQERTMYTTYFGGCGKWDQSFLHIGTGGPHVVVNEALVGGQGT